MNSSDYVPNCKFQDARMPTAAERQKLSRLMDIAFCDTLAREGRNQKAKDLAEAFHNIPLMMHTSDFSFTAFRDFLDRYQQKYEGQARFNYLQEWEKLTGNAPAQ